MPDMNVEVRAKIGYVRLSIKIIMFPVYRAGGYIRADWELFFPFFIFFIFIIIFYYLLTKKKKKLRQPDWPQFWPPAGQETDFFSWTALV